MGSVVRFADLAKGDVIDWRGTRAVVTKVWHTAAKSPIRGFPAGYEFEVEHTVACEGPHFVPSEVEGENPVEVNGPYQKTAVVTQRVIFPTLTHDERVELSNAAPDRKAYAAKLSRLAKAELATVEISRWGGDG